MGATRPERQPIQLFMNHWVPHSGVCTYTITQCVRLSFLGTRKNSTSRAPPLFLRLEVDGRVSCQSMVEIIQCCVAVRGGCNPVFYCIRFVNK